MHINKLYILLITMAPSDLKCSITRDCHVARAQPVATATFIGHQLYRSRKMLENQSVAACVLLLLDTPVLPTTFDHSSTIRKQYWC